MKKYFLVSLLFIYFALDSKGQGAYIPLPESNTRWLLRYYDDGGNATMYFDQYKIAAINYDTIIQSKHYSKININNWFTLNFPDSLQLYVGCIRNDTMNKAVYYVAPDSTNEYLLLKFGGHINDTIKNVISYSGITVISDYIINDTTTAFPAFTAR